MAGFANSSAARVSYILETTPGTIPTGGEDAGPAWQRLRVTDDSFDVDRETVNSQELDPSGNIADAVVATGKPGGGSSLEWSDGSFEDILALVCRSDWATDVLVNGITDRSMAVEVEYPADDGSIFKRFTGCRASTFSLNFTPGKIVTGSFDVLGTSAAYDTAIITNATYVDANDESVMVSSLDFGSLALAGFDAIDGVASISMKIDSQLRARYLLNGSVDPASIGFGQINITGDISFYLDAAKKPLLDAYINNTATGLSFVLGRMTLKKTQFELPTIKLSKATVAAQGNDNDVMIQASFQALRSPTLSGQTIRVTRNVA